MASGEGLRHRNNGSDGEESMELSLDLDGLPAWMALRDANPDLCQHDYFDRLGSTILRKGCIEPITGVHIASGELDRGTSWREGLAYEGVSSRVRAVMYVISSILEESKIHSPRIYAAEGVTPFAMRLRGRYSHFLGSEFTLDPEQLNQLYPIPCEDLQKLTLRSEAFDIVSTNEVLEHVPSLDAALREMHRVLRPGGWHVGTVPFAYFDETSTRRAVLDEHGEIIHLLEPEYHGDPMNGDGVLVFETPGWDVLTRARHTGFSRAFMRFIISTRYGLLSEHVGGVFVLCCQK
jgi:SAM-dependent methyltransferase